MAVGARALEDLVLKTAFGGVYAGRRVLVTGHTGFKGSWLCLWLTHLGAHVSGLALPPNTSPSHWSLLSLDAVEDLHLDLRDRGGVRQALERIRPEIVFHLAAQPLVRRSYREPLLTFETNVLGLVHLLESLRELDSARVFINATSDKVYQEQVKPAGYVEDDPLGGHDPYSTSKACAELVTACYRDSFFADTGTRVATARAGNVIGGGDWSEDRLVPDFVRAASTGKSLVVRNPDSIRPWQHVLEPLSGYLRLGQRLSEGAAVEGAWNFGPKDGDALQVRELVKQMQAIWPVECLEQPTPGMREAPALRLDSGKAVRELQWRPVWRMQEGLSRTLHWYRAYNTQKQLRSQADLVDYTAAAAKAGLPWAMA